MSNMDYDAQQPNYIPVIVSILLTIIFIFISTFALIYYFKGSLKLQEDSNELSSGNSFDLTQLKEWEKSYLNSTTSDKINIDDAVYITILRYNN